MSSTREEATVFLTGPKVRARYGVSDMTLWRWLRDMRLDFPRPTYLGRFRYWRLDDLERWERAQPRGSTRRGAKAA